MMSDMDDAVKAAEQAVHDRWNAVIHNKRVSPVDERKSLTRIAVEAAAPLIEKAVREQAAQEIKGRAEQLEQYAKDNRDGLISSDEADDAKEFASVMRSAAAMVRRLL